MLEQKEMTTKETYTALAYVIPLKSGKYAFLSACSISSPYITREDRWYHTSWGWHEKMKKFINEIKSGKRNRFINHDLLWDDMDCANAKILVRDTEVITNHILKEIKDA